MEELVRSHGDQGPLTAAWIEMRRKVAPLIKRELPGVKWRAHNNADAIDAVGDAMLDAGLGVTQPAIQAPDDMAGIATRLSHTSGAWRESYCYGKVEPRHGQAWMQAYGSTLSYLRKYEILGLAFIAGEDKDATDQRTYADPLPADRVSREEFERRLRRVSRVEELVTWATAVNDAALGNADQELLRSAYAAKADELHEVKS